MTLKTYLPLAKLLASFALLFVSVMAANAEQLVPLQQRLKILLEHYPAAIEKIDNNRIILKSGESLLIDDGKRKSHREKLENPDIEDMLSQFYPLGSCDKGEPARNFDPGRIRNDRFMRNVYGGTPAEVRQHLQNIDWFGRKLAFSKIAGAGKALTAVRDELKQLDKKYWKFFKLTAGTFNWRKISGTGRLSVHSFGAAIDLNVKFADYWRWSGGKPGNVPHYKNQIPKAIIEIFERHGFIWGGKWYHYDTMHFEYRPELIQIAGLANKSGCS